MKKAVSLIAITLLIISSVTCQVADRNWPMYRGPYASGVLDNASLPTSFDMKSGTNIKWTLDLPGSGSFQSCDLGR